MIDVRDLKKDYIEEGEVTTSALRGVSFSIKKGDFISPNGTVFNQSELKKDREVVTSFIS